MLDSFIIDYMFYDSNHTPVRFGKLARKDSECPGIQIAVIKVGLTAGAQEEMRVLGSQALFCAAARRNRFHLDQYPVRAVSEGGMAPAGKDCLQKEEFK